MRIANGVLAGLLILFAFVQYNDPDGLFWAAVYGAGALWCGVACLKPAIFRGVWFRLFAVSFVVALVGLIYFWPKAPGWWRQDVWWETETAREGMGMMILVIALLFAGYVALRTRRG